MGNGLALWSPHEHLRYDRYHAPAPAWAADVALTLDEAVALATE